MEKEINKRMSDKAYALFKGLCRLNDINAEYIERNSDFWGRDFGFSSCIRSSNEEDLKSALEILKSDRFKWLSGDVRTIGKIVMVTSPRSNVLIAEQTMKMANEMKEKFHLSPCQWHHLANGNKVWVGETLTKEGPVRGWITIHRIWWDGDVVSCTFTDINGKEHDLV